MGKLATGAFCADLGGKGQSNTRLVTKGRLDDYGCTIKASPSHTYTTYRCVQDEDIEASSDPRTVIYLPLKGVLTTTADEVTMALTIDAPYSTYGTLSASIDQDIPLTALSYGTGSQCQFYDPGYDGDASYPYRSPYFKIPGGLTVTNSGTINITNTLTDSYRADDVRFVSGGGLRNPETYTTWASR